MKKTFYTIMAFCFFITSSFSYAADQNTVIKVNDPDGAECYAQLTSPNTGRIAGRNFDGIEAFLYTEKNGTIISLDAVNTQMFFTLRNAYLKQKQPKINNKTS